MKDPRTDPKPETEEQPTGDQFPDDPEPAPGTDAPDDPWSLDPLSPLP